MNNKISSVSFFPYETIRQNQDKLIEDVENALLNGENLLAHAPTGIGKTAGVLAPALSYALDNNLKILFLTSRHTQHHIVIDTLKKIKEKHNIAFSVVDLIGKKFMCLQPQIEHIKNSEFVDYCRLLKEHEGCNFYGNTKTGNKISFIAKKIIEDIKKSEPKHIESIIKICKEYEVCPYEIATNAAKDAEIIIADYYYVFNDIIRTQFFSKTGISLDKSILIIDEGHNLPKRLVDLLSSSLSSKTLLRAIKEAKKFKQSKILEEIVSIQDFLNELAYEKLKSTNEALIKKEEFIKKIEDYDRLISTLELTSDFIREQQRRSAIGAVARFLKSWKGADDGFVRILSTQEKNVLLNYKCIDPSSYASKIVNETHSTILMSGTLEPIEFYADILGFENHRSVEYQNPFPKENRLNIMVPLTTTKYERRDEEQFKSIANICSDILNSVPGNTLIYFPSYELKDKIKEHIIKRTRKTILSEEQNMHKKERKELLQRFKEYKNNAALLSVISGSFSEGIDLPGIVKCVIVVGIPFQRPDLETNYAIEYFNKKFGKDKGKDYGYILPAINKIMQAAGRCIRSEYDRGVVILLDQRYPYYRDYFKGMEIIVSTSYLNEITKFFNIEN